MRENINKVSQRGERLDSLQDKTDNLATSAQGFRRGANRVRKQMWWKDMKMRICIIVGIIILLLIIIIPSGKLEDDRNQYNQALKLLSSCCYSTLSTRLVSLMHNTPGLWRYYCSVWYLKANGLETLPSSRHLVLFRHPVSLESNLT